MSGSSERPTLTEASAELLALREEQVRREAAVPELARLLRHVALEDEVTVARVRGREVHTLTTSYSFTAPAEDRRTGRRLPPGPPALYRTAEIEKQEPYPGGTFMLADFEPRFSASPVTVDLEHPPSPGSDAFGVWRDAAAAFYGELPALVQGISDVLVRDTVAFRAAVSDGSPDVEPPLPVVLAASAPGLEAMREAVLDAVGELRTLRELRDSAAAAVVEASTETAGYLREEFPQLVSDLGMTVVQRQARYRSTVRRVPWPSRRVDVPALQYPWSPDPVEAPPAFADRRWELTDGWTVDPHDALRFLQSAAPRLTEVASQLRRQVDLPPGGGELSA